MELNLAGKTAWVTGGSLGIGRASAAALAAEGVDVAISARNAERLADAAAELSRIGPGRVVAVPANTGVAADILAAFARARAELGPIDILVNNAGDIPAGSLMTLSDETWRDGFDVKLMGYLRCAKAVLPEMRSRGWGRVINIIGAAAEYPSPGYLAGSAFNAAVVNVTKALATETGPDGVQVIGINPGAIETDRLLRLRQGFAQARGISPDEHKTQTAAGVALRRIGKPEEIGDVVAFLCSDRASYVNGTVISVNGGH